jgi:hypothetical protein
MGSCTCQALVLVQLAWAEPLGWAEPGLGSECLHSAEDISLYVDQISLGSLPALDGASTAAASLAEQATEILRSDGQCITASDLETRRQGQCTAPNPSLRIAEWMEYAARLPVMADVIRRGEFSCDELDGMAGACGQRTQGRWKRRVSCPQASPRNAAKRRSRRSYSD